MAMARSLIKNCAGWVGATDEEKKRIFKYYYYRYTQ